MISFLVGILILIAIFGFVYFIRTRKETSETSEGLTPVLLPIPVPNEIKGEDVVLALLTELGTTQLDNSYAILWNGNPGKMYKYLITENGTEVAKG